jgi:hypothetical protein
MNIWLAEMKDEGEQIMRVLVLAIAVIAAPIPALADTFCTTSCFRGTCTTTCHDQENNYARFGRGLRRFLTLPPPGLSPPPQPPERSGAR